MGTNILTWAIIRILTKKRPKEPERYTPELCEGKQPEP